MSYAAMNSGIDQYQQVGAYSGAAYADPHRLIEMLLDGGIDRIAQAKGALLQGDRATKSQLIGKAIAIIDGLRGGLDQETGGELAANLDNLYDYMQRRLVSANAQNDEAMLDEVSDLLKQIREAWQAIPKELRDKEAAKRAAANEG